MNHVIKNGIIWYTDKHGNNIDKDTVVFEDYEKLREFAERKTEILLGATNYKISVMGTVAEVDLIIL